jgi:hypothetical protein
LSEQREALPHSAPAAGIRERRGAIVADKHRAFFVGNLRLNDEATATAGARAPLADELKRRLDAGFTRGAAKGD